ncbi:ZN862-like protein, partial [Mya arenaria]
MFCACKNTREEPEPGQTTDVVSIEAKKTKSSDHTSQSSSPEKLKGFDSHGQSELKSTLQNPQKDGATSDQPKAAKSPNIQDAPIPDEIIALVDNLFDKKVAHHHDKCLTSGCCTFSKNEESRNNSFKFKCQHCWLDKKISYCNKTGVWWAIYVEGDGLYCLLCRKHDCFNPQNKSKAFNKVASTRYRVEALTDHVQTQQHKNAVTTELLQRVSCFQKEIDQEMFLVLGEAVENVRLEKLKKAIHFGILVDEVTNISMVTFVQFYDRVDKDVKTVFLSIDNLLEEFDSANAQADPNFKSHGSKDMQLIAEYFNLDSDELNAEWGKFKYNLLKWKSEIETITQSDCLKRLVSLSYFYPILSDLAEIILSLPVSNAWPERGASAVKRIKTRLRSSLKNDMLQALMSVSINGPDVLGKEFDNICGSAVKLWLSAKNRK